MNKRHYTRVFSHNPLPIAQRVIQSGCVKWPFRCFSSSHRRTGVEQWYAGYHNTFGTFYPESTQPLLSKIGTLCTIYTKDDRYIGYYFCDYQPLRPWNFMIEPHQAISESCYRGHHAWHDILLSCPFRQSASECTRDRESIREAYQRHHQVWMNRR